MMNVTPATPTISAVSDGTSDPTWTSTTPDRSNVTNLSPTLRNLLAANSRYLDHAETNEPLLANARADQAAAAYAANVYGSSSAAFISGAINDRQPGAARVIGPPSPAETPVRPPNARDHVEMAITAGKTNDLKIVYEAAAGLVWNHLGWVPGHDWMPIVGPHPAAHHGSPAWRSTYMEAAFADDLVMGSTLEHYPYRVESMLLCWSYLLGEGFQGIRVISALAPDTNLWVYANGVIVPMSEAPPYARRIQDYPGSTIATAAQDALANPWRSALETLHRHEDTPASIEAGA